MIGAGMLKGRGTGRQEQSGVGDDEPEEEDALMIPLTMPLIVGPGAIATTIAISSQGDENAGVIAASIGAAVVAIAALVSFGFMSNVIANMKPASIAIITRIGGLLLVTIGAQMLLTGIKNFFA